MRKRFKLLSLLLLSLLLLGLVGCGDNNTNNKTNDSTKKNPPTNQEYYDYLTERYNHYFNNLYYLNNFNKVFLTFFPYYLCKYF